MSNNPQTHAFNLILEHAGEGLYRALVNYATLSESPAELNAIANVCSRVAHLYGALELVTTDGEQRLGWYAEAARKLHAQAEALDATLEGKTDSAR